LHTSTRHRRSSRSPEKCPLNDLLERSHRCIQLAPDPLLAPIGLPRRTCKHLRAALLQRQPRVTVSQAANETLNIGTATERIRNQLPGAGHAHETAPCLLQQLAFERAATIRTKRVDAAARPLERPAWQHQDAV